MLSKEVQFFLKCEHRYGIKMQSTGVQSSAHSKHVKIHMHVKVSNTVK